MLLRLDPRLRRRRAPQRIISYRPTAIAARRAAAATPPRRTYELSCTSSRETPSALKMLAASIPASCAGSGAGAGGRGRLLARGSESDGRGRPPACCPETPCAAGSESAEAEADADDAGAFLAGTADECGARFAEGSGTDAFSCAGPDVPAASSGIGHPARGGISSLRAGTMESNPRRLPASAGSTGFAPSTVRTACAAASSA